MSEKSPDDEFEDDDDSDDIVEDTESVDIDHLFRDIEKEKRKRASAKPGDPAWRRLEKYREERHTAELVSDFDDYDINAEEDADASTTTHRRAG